MRRPRILASEKQGNIHYEAVTVSHSDDLQLSHFLEAPLVVFEAAA